VARAIYLHDKHNSKVCPSPNHCIGYSQDPVDRIASLNECKQCLPEQVITQDINNEKELLVFNKNLISSAGLKDRLKTKDPQKLQNFSRHATF
jgi:hypothetical protein